MATRHLAFVFVLSMLTASACDNERRDRVAATTTTILRADVGPSPPGTRLASELVVPTGTHLIGRVFPRPAPVPNSTVRSSVAVLGIDGDPFAAWDDLARQARAAGIDFPGSRGCYWEQTHPSGQPPLRSVSLPRRRESDAVRCAAYAMVGFADAGLIGVNAELWWSPAASEIAIEITEGSISEPQLAEPASDPRPAPTAASEQLPERRGHDLPGVGEPFGRETNCFEAGYQRFRVPEGSRVLGAGLTTVLGDFAAVLVVSDARAVLESLGRQVDPSGPSSGETDVVLQRERVATGELAWTLTASTAGGGVCDMWSSPDGAAVFVTARSD